MGGIPEMSDYVVTVPLTVRQLRIYQRIQKIVEGDRQVSYWSVIHMLTRLVNSTEITLAGRKSESDQVNDGSDDDSDDDLEDCQINQTELIEKVRSKIEQLPADDQPDPESERELPEGSTDVARALGASPAKGKLTKMIILDAVATDEKVLVFSSWVSVVTEASKSLEVSHPDIKQSLITGAVPNSTRDKFLKNFQESDTRVLFLTLGTCGTGLNLQAASRVVLLDGSWNPQKLTQAIGRAYRLGQEQHVQCYRFVARGSFEEQIAKVTIAKTWLKRRMMDSIYDKTQNFEDCESSLNIMCSLDCLNIPTSSSERARNAANAARTPMLKKMIDSGCVVSTMNFYDFFKEESRGLTTEQKQKALRKAPIRKGKPYGIPAQIPSEVALLDDPSDVEFESKDRIQNKNASEEIDLAETLQEMLPITDVIKTEVKEEEVTAIPSHEFDFDMQNGDDDNDFAILDELLPVQESSCSDFPVVAQPQQVPSRLDQKRTTVSAITENDKMIKRPKIELSEESSFTRKASPVKPIVSTPKPEPASTSSPMVSAAATAAPHTTVHKEENVGSKQQKCQKDIPQQPREYAEPPTEAPLLQGSDQTPQPLSRTMQMEISQPSPSWVGTRFTRSELNRRFMNLAMQEARWVLGEAENTFRRPQRQSDTFPRVK